MNRYQPLFAKYSPCCYTCGPTWHTQIDYKTMLLECCCNIYSCSYYLLIHNCIQLLLANKHSIKTIHQKPIFKWASKNRWPIAGLFFFIAYNRIISADPLTAPSAAVSCQLGAASPSESQRWPLAKQLVRETPGATRVGDYGYGCTRVIYTYIYIIIVISMVVSCGEEMFVTGMADSYG